MDDKGEQRIAAKIAKTMAMLCVRNTRLETLHEGRTPTTHTGDYSDVKVIDADGNEIPWTEVSRCNQDEMKALMKQVVNRIYTFHLKMEDPGLHELADRWSSDIARWDEPEIDEFFNLRNREPTKYMG
ncbi:hypothetical protein Mmc1_1351 [Magnetococcus marinus MC-1]|uniref:Uncharacterized protein n=1 Tax=Magnetococcus marinus (strain ATCC BAA-1437 / JCM 17883 / MC-1) TaxID=156889 RepID=A0L7B9_MAGMM|nr:hypothetical protein [Magnetococcus marinus]ABK43862.1 hypothetical protein Mmc1_1351 [Magnetococcus marinus MC-1]